MIDRDFIASIHAICIEAGEAIMPYFPADKDAGVTYKKDGSPVTLADTESEAIILAGLEHLTPNIPVIAEEESESGKSPDIDTKKPFWLVDPLDGTKEFKNGDPEFCINIALIDNGVPVFGAVYCPATGDFYYGGISIGGAFLNGAPIQSKKFNADKGFVLVTAYGLKTSPKVQDFMKDHKIDHTVTRGATLKFCMVAEGLADLYPRYNPCYEWDSAAAHALLLAVDGDILDLKTKQRLTYGKSCYKNSSILIGSNQALMLMC